MLAPHAYPVGAVVEWSDCLGRPRGQTTVTDHPGPWTVATSCGRWIPVGLITRRVDQALEPPMSIFSTTNEGGKIDTAPARGPDRRGQLSLF